MSVNKKLVGKQDNNLDGLREHLKQDHERVSINPVRFINVDSMAMWIEVKKYLMYLSEETIRLSEFCEEQDTTPNINRVSTKLKNVQKSSLVMIPFVRLTMMFLVGLRKYRYVIQR